MPLPKVKCPTCGRSIDWSRETPWRPFCSERCKLIDLGAWLSEERGIPSEDSSPESGVDRNSDQMTSNE